MSVTLRHRLEYLLYRAVEAGVRLLGWTGAQRLGRLLGRGYHLLDGRHRRVVRENLRAADLGLSEAQVRALARDCFAHFGAMALTTLRLLHGSPQELEARVRFEGLEHWDAALAEGRGFIGLTGHYGNWEAMALALSLRERPLAVIGRELDNPLLEPHLRALRGRYGNRVVPKRGAMRDALKLLRAGQGVGFLLDQDARGHGVFARFLGRWASVHPTAAQLAVKYDLPVVPIFSFPEGAGVGVRIAPAFRVPRTGDAEKDVWVATQLMTWCIEARIRQEPRCWFWMHRRWKTQPGRPKAPALPPEDWQAAAAEAWAGLGMDQAP